MIARRLAAALLLVGCAAPLAAQQSPAIQLPEIRGKPARDWCPTRDDPRARALWMALRARYDAATDTATMWSSLRNSTVLLPAERVGFRDSIPTADAMSAEHDWNTRDAVRNGQAHLLIWHRRDARGGGERGMNGQWRREWRVRIQREGYALPFARPGHAAADIGGAYERWEYPPLEGELATHWVEPLFAERNLLMLEPAANGEVEIRFCTAPRFRRQPSIEGTLRVTRDTLLRRAEWRYRTSGARELAGGAADFDIAPRARILPRFLLPVRGLYYRRGSQMYFVRQQEFEGWQLGPYAAWFQDPPAGGGPLRPGAR